MTEAERMGEGLTETLHSVSADELVDALMGLSHHKLMRLRAYAGDVIRDKYPDNCRKPKYGRLPRAMRTPLLRQLIDTTRNPKIRAAWLIMLAWGLRIGELSTVEVLPGGDLIKIWNAKCRRVDYLPIYPSAAPLLAWLPEVKKLSKYYIAKCFRAVRRECGGALDHVYAHAKPTKKHPEGRPLNQYTSHSIRHTIIDYFADAVMDPAIYMSFSRHEPSKHLGTVAVYHRVGLDKLRPYLEQELGPLIRALDEGTKLQNVGEAILQENPMLEAVAGS